MVKEQLTKGNELDQDIKYLGRDTEKLNNCIKEVAFSDSDYCVKQDTIEIRVGGKTCNVLKSTFEVFLYKELETVKGKKEALELEFKQL